MNAPAVTFATAFVNTTRKVRGFVPLIRPASNPSVCVAVVRRGETVSRVKTSMGVGVVPAVMLFPAESKIIAPMGISIPTVDVASPDAVVPAKSRVTVKVVVADVEDGKTDFTVGVPVTEVPFTTVNELVATPVTASGNTTVKVGVDCAPIRDGLPTPRVMDVTNGATVSKT